MITKPKIQIDLKQVESLAANGLTQEQIACALGISERTLRSRKGEIADFADAIKRGKAKGIALVTNKLMESIKAGNMTGMIFFLKTQAGWKETNVQEHTGANGGAIQVNTTVMTPEEAYNLLINGGTIKTD